MGYTMKTCREMSCKAEICGDTDCQNFRFNKERLRITTGEKTLSYNWLESPENNHCWVSPSDVICDPPVKKITDLIKVYK
ncbi:hypothetical protein [Fictibacillus arsenicus]|uniref:Uncharacterized protein n=1 Tax=Fictibacillus arsenicus TaxID=255247 RepID=A0A1V3G5T3_9BACL|nr:hypothetical protein [Fictibacillus arsenicus]OOE10821.1 hypothetical protein UN64_15870 [Fictibacillus arsenicus]